MVKLEEINRRMLRCVKCNSVIETTPLSCGYDMVYNEITKQFECYMGPNCGYIPLNEMICETCAKDLNC